MTTTANETKHTPEPWELLQWESTGRYCVATPAAVASASGQSFIRDALIRYIADIRGPGTPYKQTAESTANAHRIVACVNALAGIDNPAQFIERAKRIEAAAKNAHEYLGKLTFIDGDGAGANVAVRKELRAALEAQ